MTSPQSQLARATNFLQLEMGLGLQGHRENIPITFTRAEYNKYTARFRSLDTENKGYITVNDLRRYFKVSRLVCAGRPAVQSTAAHSKQCHCYCFVTFIEDFVSMCLSVW